LGNLREKSAKPVLDLIAKEPVVTRDELKQGLVNTDQLLLSWGITSIQEPGAPMDFLPIYRELINEGKLHVRNSFIIAPPTLGRSYHRNERYQLAVDISVKAGYSTNFGDNHLKFAGIKLGHDGSMSAGNCAVYEPYLNYPTPDNCGVVHGYTNEELNDGRALAEFSPIVIKLHKAGMRSGVGAIGDRGIDFFLDCIEAAYNKNPRPDSRHSLEHCSLPTLEAMERMKKMGITSSTSVGFGWELGDQHRGFMGMERMKRYMPMKTFKEMGIVASGNADWPVCSANVMEGIHVCVNRTSETGQDLSKNQAINVMDALRVYTWNGAYITFEEDIKGSIETGKLADMAILDTDILTCDPADIVKTKVFMTILDGRIVFTKK
jgi:predicted amidohydrolase YtcJ